MNHQSSASTMSLESVDESLDGDHHHISVPKRMPSVLGSTVKAASGAMKSGIFDTSSMVLDTSNRVLDTSGRVLHSTAKATAKATGAVGSSIRDTSGKVFHSTAKVTGAVRSSIVDASGKVITTTAKATGAVGSKVIGTSGRVIHTTAKATGAVGSTIVDTSGRVIHKTAKAPVMARRAVKKSNRAYKEAKHSVLLNTYKKATEEKGRSFDKLKDIERHRRAVLKKTEIGNPFVSILFYEGAGVAPTIQDPVLLFTLLIYIIARLLVHFKYYGDENDKSELFEHFQLGLFGGLLNLFQIMFLQQNYSRFQQRYMASMAISGRIADITALACSNLDQLTSHRLVRYLNALHITGYVGLSKTYTTENFFDEFNNEWKLLNEYETQRMKEIDIDSGGDAYREIVVWCLTIIRQEYDNGKIDRDLANQLRDKVLAIRGKYGDLYDFADQPLPFFFMYFVDYLQILYLPLLAASIAFGTPVDPFSPITEFVACAAVVLGTFFTVGMRVFGYMIDDPYGDDLTDLSVLSYITDRLESCYRMLDAPDMATFDTMGETAMLLQRRDVYCEEPEMMYYEEEDDNDNLDPEQYQSEKDFHV